jgi:hypothetical protein
MRGSEQAKVTTAQSSFWRQFTKNLDWQNRRLNSISELMQTHMEPFSQLSTVFAAGTATETFVWVKNRGNLKLYGYHLQSNTLLLDGGE